MTLVWPTQLSQQLLTVETTPTLHTSDDFEERFNSCKRPVGRPRLRWLNHIEGLGWNRLGLSLSEMEEVVEDRDM